MIYLSGALRLEVREDPRIGYLLTPISSYSVPHDGKPWGADTGCFAAPQKHDDARYLAWLEKHDKSCCLFATAPDVVGDAHATLSRAIPMLARIRATGFPAGLVAQDGLEKLIVPWDLFDCLFVGGTTKWKLSEEAYALVREAKARGKWCHMGRVNSEKRLVAARAGGYDSADGTFIAFAPNKNITYVRRWLDNIEQQPILSA